MNQFKIDQQYMQQALILASDARAIDEVPVGAVIVSRQSGVLSEAYNLKESQYNPCGHAEILAIIEAAKKMKSWRLLDCTIYVTLEPCPMCLSAILQTRIERLVFGAYDKKGGALSLGYNFSKDERLNHSFIIHGGYQHFECSKILSDYFRTKRKNYTPPF